MSYSGEPNAHVLCHCLDCRKISGSTYSNNIVVPEDNFKLVSGISSSPFSSRSCSKKALYRLTKDHLQGR